VLESEYASTGATVMAGSGTAHLRSSGALLRAEHLTQIFRSRGQRVHALSDVSFDVMPGETLGIVGESGCGKSTLARSILMLPSPTSGTVQFKGQAWSGRSQSELRTLRKSMQPIFQDPVASLNPRQRVLDIVAAPLEVHGIGTRSHRIDLAAAALASVGLDPESAGNRLPHELSGGQCQRVSIARALVLQPSLIVCDEPVASLDVSVQAQVVNLLEQAKAQHRLTLIFISHDLAVVKSMSDRVMVMYLGKVCEIGTADDLYREPRHPYTAALLAAIPTPDAKRSKPLAPLGELPSPLNVPPGCRFHPRCPRATDVCRQEEPQLRRDGNSSYFACHHPLPAATSV
jgi:peptide/nickel transport system ATP-binding protein